MQTGYFGSKVCAFAGDAIWSAPSSRIIKTEKRIRLSPGADRDIIAWLKWCKANQPFNSRFMSPRAKFPRARRKNRAETARLGASGFRGGEDIPSPTPSGNNGRGASRLLVTRRT